METKLQMRMLDVAEFRVTLVVPASQEVLVRNFLWLLPENLTMNDFGLLSKHADVSEGPVSFAYDLH